MSRTSWRAPTPITAPGRCPSDAPELPLAAAAARVAASDAFCFAAKENIQTHGGIGFTWEFDCHLYYRRAKLLALALGCDPHLEGPADHLPRTRNDGALEGAAGIGP